MMKYLRGLFSKSNPKMIDVGQFITEVRASRARADTELKASTREVRRLRKEFEPPPFEKDMFILDPEWSKE